MLSSNTAGFARRRIINETRRSPGGYYQCLIGAVEGCRSLMRTSKQLTGWSKRRWEPTYPRNGDGGGESAYRCVEEDGIFGRNDALMPGFYKQESNILPYGIRDKTQTSKNTRGSTECHCSFDALPNACVLAFHYEDSNKACEEINVHQCTLCQSLSERSSARNQHCKPPSHCTYANSIFEGSCTYSLILTRNCTASLPSRSRWS